MSQVRSVAAIENGTVIDHIPAGEGMRIVRLLGLSSHSKKVTLGLNLPSKSLGIKDLIKVEGREVSEEEANQIALFAPKATLNIIRNFVCVKKFSVKMQETIERLINCPNPSCITNHEQTVSRFHVHKFGHKVTLTCIYCDKRFSHDMY